MKQQTGAISNLLLQLENECVDFIEKSDGETRVQLRYFQANAVSGISRARLSSQNASWSFDLTNRVKHLLLLRQAVSDPDFQTTEQVIQFQIRTNLANALLA